MAQIIHSANVRVGGGGHGHTVFEIAQGLNAIGLLDQLIVSSIKSAPVPRQRISAQGFWGRAQKRLVLYDSTGWSDYFSNRIFDLWAARVMRSADIFESWTAFCETSLEQAKKKKMRTVLHLGSAHPRAQIELVNAERKNWGLEPIAETPMVSQIVRELERADRVVVQSQFSWRTLVERGIPSEKIICLPLGVDVKNFTPAHKQSDLPFRVLFVGQISLRKGVHHLLETWRQLAWRDAELWLVGKVMPDAHRVLRQYADLPGVKLIGYLPQPAQAFRSSHVFILPSVEDGFALVVTEAMASGLPVIVSNHVGAADLVQEGENGFIIEYNQPHAYARALEILRANPVRARTMGLAGREVALAKTWDAYCAKLSELHSEMA